MVRTKHLLIVVMLMLGVVFTSSFFAMHASERVAEHTGMPTFAIPADTYSVASVSYSESHAREALIAKVRDSLESDQIPARVEPEDVPQVLEDIPPIPHDEPMTLPERGTSTVSEWVPPDISIPQVATTTIPEPLVSEDVVPVTHSEAVE